MEKKEEKKVEIEEKSKTEKVEELSEQDKELKEKIDFKVERICLETEMNPVKNINDLFEMLITTKKSRTSIPKEIKFLKIHYSKLVEEYEKTKNEEKKRNLADLLSFASISLSENYERDSIRYLQNGTGEIVLEKMGEEYVLNLAGDLADEYKARYNDTENPNFEDILQLVDEILPLLFSRGDDISALDLLMDIEKIDRIIPHINKENYSRLFQYLLCSLEYSSDNEEFNSILNNLFNISMKQGDLINAMRVSIRQNNMTRIKQVFQTSKNDMERKQLCFALARHRIILKEVEEEELVKIMSNSMLTEFYMKLVKDLDVLKPKKPREIYKEMLGEKEESLDSALLNLADSFVNAFVNVGTGKDTLLNIDTDKKEDKLWIQRVKDKGIMSTVASLGLIYLWNFEEFQVKLSDYLDLKDGYAKAGACIALGLSTSGIWDESDPAMAILMDAMESNEECMKLGSAIGLGLAYATSSREEFKEPFAELINDENLQIETSVSAALSLSLIFVSECDEDVINTILTSMMIFGKDSLDKPFAKFFGVALAINFLGRQKQSETCIEALEAIEHPIAKYAVVAIETCAYIGSGNVLLIQKYMQLAGKHFDEETQKDEIEQVCLGLIGVALISVSEVVGTKMIIRNIHHIMQYCDLPIKRVVPIMLTIVGIRNLDIQVTDLLYKLAHDEDKEIALRALLGLGVIAAGSNNSRIGGLLRNLGLYYENENDYLYVIRIALGILYAGKGLVGLNQYYSDGFLYNKTGFAGLFMFFHSMLNLEEFLIKNNHYMFFYFSLGFYPKMLFILDENLENIKVNVRVGQAIDTVGQVGKPRKITGFQTHTSPVVIDNGERSELATEEYITVGQTILENLVIVKKNPDYEEERK